MTRIEIDENIDEYVYHILTEALIHGSTILLIEGEGMCILANNGKIFYIPRYIDLDLFILTEI